MKNLHFDYCMEISYSVDVSRCYYTIKCIPQDTERQRITGFQIDMVPQSKPEWAYDSLGNRYIWGCNGQPHSYFKFRISGDVECKDCNFENYATENELMIFKHGTKLTEAGENITKFYHNLVDEINGFEDLTPLEKAKQIMNKLHDSFEYTKGETSVATTAEEAFSLNKGVCQDYSHIMVALLHLAGCSARYVTGLIIGEGESHAWVEVADSSKWYGLDPTNNVLVGDGHIKIGVGRDATECQINRGIMHGGGEQHQNISVSVTPISPGRNFLRKGALL